MLPRLSFYLHNGHWCDHKTYQFRSWMDEVDAADISHGRIVADVDLDSIYQPDVGFDQGVLIDLGRDKLYTCQRCGHQETSRGRMMTGFGQWISRVWRSDNGALLLACGSIIFGIVLMIVVESLIGWR